MPGLAALYTGLPVLAALYTGGAVSCPNGDVKQPFLHSFRNGFGT